MLQNAGARPPSGEYEYTRMRNLMRSSLDPPLDYDHLFQIKIVGDKETGKSSLLRRFMDGTFAEGSVPADYFNSYFVNKKIMVKGESVMLQIDEKMDLGGIMYRQNPYKGAQGIIIVYDVTDMASLSNTKHWAEEADRWSPEYVRIVRVGTKCDLTTKNVTEGYADRDKLHFPHLETSSKTFVNVEEVFSLLASEILESLPRGPSYHGPGYCHVTVYPGKRKTNRKGKGKCKIQ